MKKKNTFTVIKNLPNPSVHQVVLAFVKSVIIMQLTCMYRDPRNGKTRESGKLVCAGSVTLSPFFRAVTPLHFK